MTKHQENVLSVAVFVFVMGAFVVYAVWEGDRERKHPTPCSHYANYPLKDVPARCVEGFDPKRK